MGCQNKEGMTYIIGITGSSGSGKTFFRQCFLEHFKPGEITLLSMDNYYFPGQTQTRKENLLHNFDLPEAIDHETIYGDIQDLMQGKTIYRKEYTFHNPHKAARILELNPSPILVIEGLFILHYPDISRLIDYKIFMQTEAQVALERRIKRDYEERGYHAEEVQYKWENHAVPAFEQYLLPYKQQCNQIIDNNGNDPSEIQEIARTLSQYLRSHFFYN